MAVAYVLSRIHEFPDRSSLRKLLADLMLQTYKDKDKLMTAASRMAESSLVLRNISKEGISSEEAARTLAIASIAVESVDRSASKILAQKAVHINPLFRKILNIC